MRMERPGRPTNYNTINERLSRTFRTRFNVLAWHGTTIDPANNSIVRAILSRVDQAHQNANSTRGYTPGLINPAQGLQEEGFHYQRISDQDKDVALNRNGPIEWHSCNVHKTLPLQRKLLI